MRVVDWATIESWAAGDNYYLGRVPYLRIAAEILGPISGDRCLEIGPYKYSLVPGCETMDVTSEYGIATYQHDAGETPWPVKGPYDVIVALQVWEHLGNRQLAASQEAFRLGRHVLLSFPYLWPGHDEHAQISRTVIANWTCDRDPVLTWRVASDHPGLAHRLDRILYLFEGDAK